ncbi:ABC transporter permease [Brucella sp. JSBI001]|nr:ABC transporter permease [Brucella sp. JSBI001]UZD70423.1 ABC transporter permease [Brucella sp. JSBI001]
MCWGDCLGFISTSLSEGCTTFSGSDEVILQIRLPLYTHIMRALWRNMIIFAHNIVIFPIIALILGRGFNLYVFLAIPGFLLICLNLAWMMLVLAIVCARFRDMTQVVINVLQVAFYATPIMWSAKALPSHVSHAFIDLNPFFILFSLSELPFSANRRNHLLGLLPLVSQFQGGSFHLASSVGTVAV